MEKDEKLDSKKNDTATRKKKQKKSKVAKRFCSTISRMLIRVRTGNDTAKQKTNEQGKEREGKERRRSKG